MIKRRFYKQEHGDKDAPSDSSSSSDSELDAEEDNDDMAMESREKEQPCSSSSGYESEVGSANEVNLDSSGLLTNDDGSEDEVKTDKDAIESVVLDCVLKSKSVFKCKLCPRIVCLTEETLKAHLQSKRHGRSEKLLREGRLKMMLDSDGEIEGETHQERHASTLALAESKKSESQVSKKNKGRQRQRERKKLKKVQKTSDDDFKSKNTKRSAKKRRKSDIRREWDESIFGDRLKKTREAIQ